MRVSANGGVPQLVVPAKEGEFVYGPQLLPGGDAVLFTATTVIGRNRWDAAQVVVQSLSSGERTVLLQGSDARYVATGHLLYAQDDALFAVPFNPGRRALLGGPVSVVNSVVRAGDQARQTPAANYGISDNGTLVYLTGRGFDAPSPFGTLVRVDRRGREEPLGAPRLRYPLRASRQMVPGWPSRHATRKATCGSGKSRGACTSKSPPTAHRTCCLPGLETLSDWYGRLPAGEVSPISIHRRQTARAQ